MCTVYRHEVRDGFSVGAIASEIYEAFTDGLDDGIQLVKDLSSFTQESLEFHNLRGYLTDMKRPTGLKFQVSYNSLEQVINIFSKDLSKDQLAAIVKNIPFYN
ncbi:MAG: hypothetical protein ACI83O_000799 [Patescibacteria group bacterium]|jgi:hypothetical protein